MKLDSERRAPVFVIADPSLIDASGHHQQLSEVIGEPLLALGWRVVWATHKNFVGCAPPGIEVYRVFDCSIYESRPSVDAMKQAIENICDVMVLLRQRLQLVRQDIIFTHSAFTTYYLGIERLISLMPDFPAQHHVATPFSLNVMPNPCQDIDVIASLKRLAKIVDARKPPVYFYAETDELAVELRKATELKVMALTLPAMRQATGLPAQWPFSDDEIVLTFLGAGRVEKGFLHLAEILPLIQRMKRTSGISVRLYVQAKSQRTGWDPQAASVLEELRKEGKDFVHIREGDLAGDEYFEVIARSDFVLTLYDRERYKTRGSGIVIDAICEGTPVIAFKRTFPGGYADRYHGVSIDSVAELPRQLTDYWTDRANRRQRMEKSALNYLREYSPYRYVASLIHGHGTGTRYPLPSQLYADLQLLS